MVWRQFSLIALVHGGIGRLDMFGVLSKIEDRYPKDDAWQRFPIR
jgi:hypothetical protein